MFVCVFEIYLFIYLFIYPIYLFFFKFASLWIFISLPYVLILSM